MRKITELIWHCTATPEGREVSPAEIDRWHKARGWNGIGYHKVVHLDGSVSEGRPESKIGAHVADHNTGTIGYVYVGGVHADDVHKAKDTRTPSQKVTMERLTREAIARYGLTKVSGHNQYANKACPCFDAQAEYVHLLRPEPVMPEGPEPDPVPPRPSPHVDPSPPVEPEPLPQPEKPGLFKRIRKWIGAISGGTGVGIFAYLTDWRVWVAAGGVVLVLGAVAFGVSLFLFGRERVANWVKRKIG